VPCYWRGLGPAPCLPCLCHCPDFSYRFCCYYTWFLKIGDRNFPLSHRHRDAGNDAVLCVSAIVVIIIIIIIVCDRFYVHSTHGRWTVVRVTLQWRWHAADAGVYCITAWSVHEWMSNEWLIYWNTSNVHRTLL